MGERQLDREAWKALADLGQKAVSLAEELRHERGGAEAGKPPSGLVQTFASGFNSCFSTFLRFNRLDVIIAHR